MGRFDRAQASLVRRKKAAEGVSITYRRLATTYPLTGWLGRTVFASNAEGGARVEFGDRDFFFAAADLTAAGLNEPRVGDRLTVAGESVTFEVLTPDTGEPAWRYSDPQRTEVRIHTKRVS